jgi:hypothetical protein
MNKPPGDPELERNRVYKERFARSLYVSGETRIMPLTKILQDQEQAWGKLFADISAYVTTLQKCSFFFAEMFRSNASFKEFTSHRNEVLSHSAALARSGIAAPFRPLLFAARLRYPSRRQSICTDS